MANKSAYGIALGVALTFLASLPSHASILNLTAFLSPDNEVPPATSDATGGAGAVFVVDTTSNLLAWTIAFENLTGPATLAHFHSSPPGVSGPVEINLDTGENLDDAALNATVFTSGIGSTSGIFQGNGALSAAQAADLLAGNLYINVHTDAFPDGELRGQLLGARAVPLPAALWLFGSGLLGLVVVARRKHTI